MKLKIAVCDDDLQWSERIRQSISEYMCHENQQCDIQVFESGEELCSAFHGSHSFDIVFLDVDMDEMDGMETAEMIRSRSDQVTIVFITGVVEAAPRSIWCDALYYEAGYRGIAAGMFRELFGAIFRYGCVFQH